MRVLVVYQEGERGWGKRIVDFMQAQSPEDWELAVYRMPFPLPPIIDEPAEYLPADLPSVELLLVLAEDIGLAQLIPDLVRLADAGALLAPVDNDDWLPAGLINQIKGKLEAEKVDYDFPRPFCSFNPTGGRKDWLKQFARYFGRPAVSLSPEGESIRQGSIRRDCPCGSTRYVLKRIDGVRIEEAETKGGLFHQLYPCLASVDLIHASARITATAIKQAVDQA